MIQLTTTTNNSITADVNTERNPSYVQMERNSAHMNRENNSLGVNMEGNPACEIDDSCTDKDDYYILV